MLHRKILIVPLCAMALSACEGARQESGTVIGALAGAAVGSELAGHGHGGGKTLAIVAGALAGAYVGSEIGKQMDEADRAAMQSTTQYALESGPSGQTSEWVNPDSGNYGYVTPQPAYQSPETGQYCREYQQKVIIGGEEQQAYGTACRQPDGTWKVVSSR